MYYWWYRYSWLWWWIRKNAIHTLSTSLEQDEQKVLFVSFCQSEDDDDTCNVPSTPNPHGKVQIIVVNSGVGVSSNVEFSCLVYGGASSPKYIE